MVEAGRTVALLVRHARERGFSRIEVSKDAEEAWGSLILSGAGARMLGSQDCTPGYYSNEGHERPPAARSWAGHPQGAMAFFRHLDRWRSSGDFDGVEFS